MVQPDARTCPPPPKAAQMAQASASAVVRSETRQQPSCSRMVTPTQTPSIFRGMEERPSSSLSSTPNSSRSAEGMTITAQWAAVIILQSAQYPGFQCHPAGLFGFKETAVGLRYRCSRLQYLRGNAETGRRGVGKTETSGICGDSGIDAKGHMSSQRHLHLTNQPINQLRRCRRAAIQQQLPGVAAVGTMMVDAQIHSAAVFCLQASQQGERWPHPSATIN